MNSLYSSAYASSGDPRSAVSESDTLESNEQNFEDISMLTSKESTLLRDQKLVLWNKNINDSMIPSICCWISNLGNKVNRLDLSNNKITQVGVRRLYTGIRHNKYVHYVSLFGNSIGDEGMNDIGELLRENNIINELVIGNCNISDNGLKTLTHYILGNKSLKIIDISWNRKITELSMPLLNDICLNSCVEDIIMLQNAVPDSMMVFIYTVLSVKKRSIKKIDLSNRAINDSILKYLGFVFENFNYYDIEVIDLSGNQITDHGLTIFIPTLFNCKQLKYLNISFMRGVTDAIVPSLIELCNNINIEEINVNGTAISSTCVVDPLFIRSVMSPEYSFLDLSNRQAKDGTMKLLIKLATIFNFQSIQTLDLSNNPEITDASLPWIFELVKLIPAMKTLDTSKTSLTLSRFLSIDFIRQLHSEPIESLMLKETDLNVNRLSKILELVETYNSFENLRCIDISKNVTFNGESLAELFSLVEKAPKLERIDVPDISVINVDIAQSQFIRSIINGSIKEFRLEYKRGLEERIRFAHGREHDDDEFEQYLEQSCLIERNEARKILIFFLERLKHCSCKNLDILSISRVPINQETMYEFIDSLKLIGASPSVIALQNARINDESVKILAEFLENNEKIQEIALPENRITVAGLEVLLPSLFACVNLNSLSLSGNPFIGDESKDILENLCKTSYIKTLHLHGTSISGAIQSQLSGLLANPPENRETPLPSTAKNAKKSGYVE